MTTTSAITANLTSMVNQLRDVVTAGRGRIKALQRRVEVLEHGPIRKEEARGRIAEAVTDRGARWLTEHRGGFLTAPSSHTRPLLSAASKGRLSLPDFQQDWFGAVCAGAPDLAQAILARMVAALEYEEGPSLEERRQLLSQARAELAALEAADEAATDEAIAAGVVQLEHRRDVQQRRELEASARHRKERRRVRQAGVDHAYAESGGTRSNYLMSNSMASARVAHEATTMPRPFTAED
jgi:hypothetical protein